MSDELLAKRIDKLPDNMLVKPSDLLRATAHDLETGKIKTDSVLILLPRWYSEDSEGNLEQMLRFRAGLTRAQELVALEMAKIRHMRNWMGYEI